MSGGTVSAPGYAPIVITQTVSNNAQMAAAYASASGSSSASSTTTSTTGSVTSSGSTVTTNYVSSDRVGSSSYGVINSSGAQFAPNVQVVVSGDTSRSQEKSSSSSGI